MRLLCFDPLRGYQMRGISYLKPELMFRHRQEILAADWLLFPQYWQVNALVYGLRRRIFPSVSSYHLGHDKIEMTRAFWSVCPENVPETLILPSTDLALEEVQERFSFPLVLKDPRNARGKGVWRIDDRSALRARAADQEILYVQELLPIERDLRLVWVGDQVALAYWRIAPEGGFHNNLAQGARVDFYNVPVAALELVTWVAQELGIDHAGFDIAIVDGHPWLLEFNTFFGMEAMRARAVNVGSLVLDYLASRNDEPQDPPTRPSAWNAAWGRRTARGVRRRRAA